MTAVRATRPAGARRPVIAWGQAGILGLAVLVAACGGTPATASPAPGTPSASPSGPAGATPRPTAWPGNALLGIEALGVSDGEIRKGMRDLGQGVAEEDLALMRRAADGLAGVDVLVSNADRIAIFPPMLGLANGLRDVLPRIADASVRLRTAIDEGEGSAIAESAVELTEALSDYARLQPELAMWVEQSIDQQRMLVR